ncbi:hypothetical protein ACOSP6_04160 [Tenacibaculum sp. MEBiC06402]|uniref:hypothetical protein n=1 Tax=unclassified Tenacibaculum TaxID=2635139 RepID=UPI003B9A1CC5
MNTKILNMNSTKFYLRLKAILLVSALTLFFSCSSDENTDGRINLSVAANNSAVSNKTTQVNSKNSTVVFTEFKISIRDVVFKNDDDPNSSLDTDEVMFRGPYHIDLMANGTALEQTIGDVAVPDGTYKELRFKFHKDKTLPTTDKLYDKSIYIEGTVNDKKFIFWHDTSENLDVGRSTGVTVTEGIVNLTVEFKIQQFLNSLNQIDLSQAVDGNQNGVIEINPNDQDGNQDIAKQLKENIKETADLINQ